ncbi:MAG: class I SAM-dependent methyltransferase [Planctomycetota bacterium]
MDSDGELGRAARENVQETKACWEAAEYYDVAEEHMDLQWRETILPGIQGCDFRRVLELAPGHGRNTARLIEMADELVLVDINQSCIDRCRERFADHPRVDRVSFHVNDGTSLPMVADQSVTLVYCWDAMVHFEPEVIQRYLREFKRLLVPGGRCALHYSNYGAHPESTGRPWRDNPHWRSAMSQEHFREYCAELGFVVVAEQLLEWDRIEALDALAVIEKA